MLWSRVQDTTIEEAVTESGDVVPEKVHHHAKDQEESR
jgi:hypothetical protein